MGCDLARQLLAIRQAVGPAELSAEDAAVLDRHLAGCPDCSAEAARQAGWDNAVRSAMTAVPVPAGLRDRLIATAAARQAVRFRRTLTRYAAVAAVVLVAAPLGYGVYLRSRPVLDTAAIAEQSSREFEDQEAAVRALLTAEGLPTTLPQRFDYQKCRVKTGYARVGGEKVPCIDLTVVRPNQTDDLRVLIARRTQFRLDDVRPAGSSFATVTADRDPANGLVYVYVASSPTLDPFLAPPAPVN